MSKERFGLEELRDLRDKYPEIVSAKENLGQPLRAILDYISEKTADRLPGNPD